MSSSAHLSHHPRVQSLHKLPGPWGSSNWRTCARLPPPPLKFPPPHAATAPRPAARTLPPASSHSTRVEGGARGGAQGCAAAGGRQGRRHWRSRRSCTCNLRGRSVRRQQAVWVGWVLLAHPAELVPKVFWHRGWRGGTRGVGARAARLPPTSPHRCPPPPPCAAARAADVYDLYDPPSPPPLCLEVNSSADRECLATGAPPLCPAPPAAHHQRSSPRQPPCPPRVRTLLRQLED